MFNLNNISTIKGYYRLRANQKMFKDFLSNFLQSWGLETRKNIEPLSVVFVKDEEGSYLRFTYKIYGKKEWLHVTDVKNWY